MRANWKFWMVWSPQGAMPPRRKHESYVDALKAAEEMASRYPSQEFYVVQAVSRSKSVAITTIKLEDESIPF
jgi:hypothetical protein